MSQPNILLLFPDQWRWDWMSYNTSLPLRTPNLDKLMNRGMTFKRCYTPSPVCAPARACLASGHDYARCPAPNNHFDYDLNVPTFYQALRNNGYRVAGVGKFDLHKGLKKELDWNLDGSRLLHEWGFTDGIDNEGKFDGSSSYSKAGKPKGPYMNFLKQQGVAEVYIQEHASCREMRGAYVTSLSDDQYCDNWLSQNGLDLISSMPKGTPWFMQVNFTGPHNPMEVTQKMHDQWKDTVFPSPHNNLQPDYSQDDHQRNRQHYAAMIENIDRQIGRYLELLEERGELENTIVIFSSDHGEMLGDQGLWGKSVWREPAIHIPLVISGRGINPGLESHELVSLHDLANTILEMAQCPVLEGVDSKSLVGLIGGKTLFHREHLLIGLNQWRCLVGQELKFVCGWKDLTDIVVNLKDDPLEDQNILHLEPAFSQEAAAILQKHFDLI